MNPFARIFARAATDPGYELPGRHERPAARGHWDCDGNFLGTWGDDDCRGGLDCHEHHDGRPRPFPGIVECWCGLWNYVDEMGGGDWWLTNHLHARLPDPITSTDALPF